MPGSETGEEFLARFDAAVRTIVDAGHDAALVVSHGAALRTWVSTRMDPHPDAPPPTEPLHNTALIVLEGDVDAGWRMVSWQGHPVGGATPRRTGRGPDRRGPRRRRRRRAPRPRMLTP